MKYNDITKKIKPHSKHLFIVVFIGLAIGLTLIFFDQNIAKMLSQKYHYDGYYLIRNKFLYFNIVSFTLLICSFIRNNICLWVNKLIASIIHCILRWGKHFALSISKDTGYLVVASILGIYITIFSLIESKATRDSTNQSSKYSVFISLVSAGNNIALKNAISMLSDLSNIQIVKEPNFFNPMSWRTKDNSLKYELVEWTEYYLSNCDAERCGNEQYRIDIAGIDLTGLLLSGIDFSNSNLENVILYNNTVENCNFSNLNLNNLIIRRSYISADLNSNEGGGGSVFINSKLRGSIIEEYDLSGCDFTDTDFSLLTKYNNFSLKKSILRYCSFQNSNLTEANMTETDIRDADFRGAILTKTIFKNAIYNEFTKFPENFNISAHKMILSTE